MSACRALETPPRVAYLGPAGTFSEQAALGFFGSIIEHVPCASIDEVFRATAAGTADFGVVPVENSTEGVVARSLDLFLHDAAASSSARPACWCATTCCARDRSLDGIEAVLRPSAGAGAMPRLAEQAPAATSSAAPVASNAEGARLARHDPALGGDRQRARGERVRAAHRRARDPGRRRTTAPASPIVCLPQTPPAPQASGHDCMSLVVSVPTGRARCTTCWCR